MPEVPRAATSSESDSEEQSPAWLIIAVGLMVARWLLPAESTTSGATLWLVGGWLLLAATWTLSRLRGHTIAPLRLDRIDLAVTLLVAPQLVSAVSLIVTSDGNARAAVNMGCEWVALLVSFVLLRRWLRERTSFQGVVHVALGVAIAISILGIWQHHFGYGQAIADFDRLETELATAKRTGNASAVRRLQSELTIAGIPLDGPARQLWERRLRDSREPYGLFALANTLGGLLAPVLLFGIAVWLPAARRSWQRCWWRGWPSTQLVLFLAGLLLMAYCLLLTKSRTAWVGFAAGGMVLVGNNLWHWLRERPRRAVLAASGPLLLVTTALMTGGIDREVLTEAPKSLTYRIEYWQGTLGVILARPLVGTGPGNFRQHYLAHKLEGSSEEIADPHNFILEATATGGVLGLAGLGACIILLANARHLRDNEPVATPLANTDEPTGVALPGGIVGFVLALAPGWILGGSLDFRLLGVLAGFVMTWMCLPAVALDRQTLRRATLAAMIVLLVHLSGAGGFSRPALMQLLLLMAIGWCGQTSRNDKTGTSIDTAELQPARLAAVGCGLLFVLVAVFGLLPAVRQSTAEQNATHSLLGGRQANAARLWQDAQQADRFDPTPPRRLARLRIDQALSDSTNDELLDQAIRAATDAGRRDPHNWATAHDLARAYRLRWQIRHDKSDREGMTHWGTTAVDRYPSNPRLHAWLAESFAEIGQGQTAADHARTTLRLHRLLEKRGHVDKLLSNKHLEQIRALVTSPATVTP